MVLADTTLDFQPAYPWSIPTIGPSAMFAVALVLAGLTVWTYLGVKQATWRRVSVVLFLRLAALTLAFVMLLRPSLAVTQPEGLETTKLLIVRDASASMDIADVENGPTRWRQVADIVKAESVQRRLRALAEDQRIEVQEFLGAEGLRPAQADAVPDGKRTDIGAWLEQLWKTHGHEKRLRGIVVFSDGADNGTQFSTLEKARRWRGVAPIHAFGAGDPNNIRFKKDLALTRLGIKPERLFVKSAMKFDVVAQAPGFERTDFAGAVWIEDVQTRTARKLADIPKFRIAQEKDQHIKIDATAPDEPGEYKITVKVTPHADETNTVNNEISTYVRVVKEKINVLWVDRPRVYEPMRIIQRALKPVEELTVHYIEVRPDTVGDPFQLYELTNHYDVIVIGDLSAKQFSLGNPKLFEKIKKMVEKKKTGLLMLGGSETFARGGWRDHPEWMSMLPVDFDLKDKNADFTPGAATPVFAFPTAQGLAQKFGRLDPDPKKNETLWKTEFEPLKGIAAVGNLRPGSTVYVQGSNKGEWILVATKFGEGHTAVFAGDSTAESWFASPEAVAGFTQFWKHLVLWMAQHDASANTLVVKLDRRRMSTDPADVLGFTAALYDKERNELTGATFQAKVVRDRDKKEFPIRIAAGRGSFQAATEPGEHRLVIEATGKNARGEAVAGSDVARFLVASDDVETLRPLADHDALARIATSSEGRFHPASEEAFLRYLDELQGQVNREARLKTTHWPDWNRLPNSQHPFDQLAGMWRSFALAGLALFVALLGCEWFLRRWWGLV